MKRKTKAAAVKPLDQTITDLLRAGKLTPESLQQAQQELDADPEW